MRILAEIFKFIKTNKIFKILIFIDFILIFLHIFLAEKYAFFNLDKEFNLPSFWSALQFFILAYLTFFTGILENVKISKTWQYLASLFFIYLGLDEFFQFHEYLGDLLGNFFNWEFAQNSLFSLNPVFAWLIVFSPLVFFVFYLWFAYFRKHLDYKLWLSLTIGASFYVLGAYVLEFWGWLIWQEYIKFFPYNLEVLLEESLELLSVSYLISIMYKYKK